MFRKIHFILVCLVVGCSQAWALRVVSLLPSNTEILEALGAGPDVVGVCRYDKFAGHPGVASVGDFVQPSVEKIVSLHPDLIVAGVWSSSHTVPRLKKMGYSVEEVQNPASLEQVYQSIRSLAKSVHREPAAEPVIDEMKRRLAKVRARAQALPRRLKTFIEIDRPYWTVGGLDFLPEAFALAGVDNIFSDLKQQAAQVSPEIIIQRNPELIISFDAKRAEIVERAGWGMIRAVQQGYLIDDLSQDDLSRPSPRLADGLEALVQRIEVLETHR